MFFMRTSAFVFPFRAFVVVVACLWFAGCASDGLKSYQRGDYYQACEEAVNKLRGKPDSAEARTALFSAYPLACAATQREIEGLGSASDLAGYERVVAACDRMDKIADDIFQCPAAFALVPNPVRYADARRSAADVAARMAYEAGVQALAAGTMAKAREALDFFTRADHYAPGFRDVRTLIEKARYEATLRVLVTRPQLTLKYQLNGEFFYNRLLAEVAEKTDKYFVRLYTPEEAATEGMSNPHQILELNFLDFTVGNTREVNNTTDLSRDNVEVGATTGADGSKQAVRGTVKARFTSSRLEIISQGVLLLRIVEAANGRVLVEKKYPGKYVWVSEWASFNGDERALNGDQIAMTKRRRQSPPSAQEMFKNFADPLYHDVTRYIVSTYSGR